MAVTTIKHLVPVTNTQQQDNLSVLINEVKISKKKNLVARWLKDENHQLYCQWVVED